MGRSGIVLLGAGLALMLGVTLLKIPATRNILTLLVLGFLTALAGLWYPAPVEVLLQPALLGLTLACLAVLIDTLVKRRAPAAGMLTISTPSDYLSAKSSVSRQQVSGAGDDEVTEVRNRPLSSVREPVSSAESGGHL